MNINDYKKLVDSLWSASNADKFSDALTAALEIHHFHPFTKITNTSSILDKMVSFDPLENRNLRKIMYSWYEQYPDIVYSAGVVKWLILENPDIIKDLKEKFHIERKDLITGMTQKDVDALPKDFFYNVIKVYEFSDMPQEKLSIQELNTIVNMKDKRYLEMRLDMFKPEQLERSLIGLKDVFLKCFARDNSLLVLDGDAEKRRELAQLVYEKYANFLTKNSSKLTDTKEPRMEIIIRDLFISGDFRAEKFKEIDLLSLDIFTKKNFPDFKYPTYKVYLDSDYRDPVRPIIRGNGMPIFDKLGILKLEKGKELHLFEEVGIPTLLLASQHLASSRDLLFKLIDEEPDFVYKDLVATKEKITAAGYTFTLNPAEKNIFEMVMLSGKIPSNTTTKKTLKV